MSRRISISRKFVIILTALWFLFSSESLLSTYFSNGRSTGATLVQAQQVGIYPWGSCITVEDRMQEIVSDLYMYIILLYIYIYMTPLVVENIIYI